MKRRDGKGKQEGKREYSILNFQNSGRDAEQGNEEKRSEDWEDFEDFEDGGNN